MGSRRGVRATYDQIAGHFAKTRPEPWPEIADFLDGRTGTKGLDIGVGNGRHAELLADHVVSVFGLDLSVAALRTGLDRADQRGFQLSAVQGDAASLPFVNDAFDLAVYIATVHHLPTRDLRVRSLNELARVLDPAGAAIVSAWSTTHPRFSRDTGFDTTIDWSLPDGETVERYYHIYDPGEFREDVASSDLTIEESFVSSGNCYAIVESK